MVGVMITSTIVISCSTPSEKVESAESELNSANAELDKANKAYLLEVETYKQEMASKVRANEKSIAEFKKRKMLDKQLAKDAYQKRLDELESKNTDIKRQIDNYQADGKEKWELFKTNMGEAMDSFTKAFTDLTSSKK